MLLTIAWRNLYAHKRKSLTALLSIIPAFISLSLFEGYLRDVRHFYNATFSQRQMLGHILIEREGARYPGKAGLDESALSKAEQTWIDQNLGKVKVRTRFLNINGSISNGQSRSIFIGLAHDPLEGAAMRAPNYVVNTFAGSPLDHPSKEEPLLLGRELSDVLGCFLTEGKKDLFSCTHGDFQLQVNTAKGQANAMDFHTTGLIATGFSEIDSHLVMLRLDTAQALFQTDRISYLTVLLEDEELIDSWVQNFNQTASQGGQKILAKRWQDHAFGDIFRQSMDFLEVFRNLAVSIILMVVSIATINTFVKTVNERTREIGTMRSIGFRPSYVIALLSSEALMLAIVGAGMGIVLSWITAGACKMMNIVYTAGLLSEGVLFRIELAPWDFLRICGLMFTLIILSTLVPAWRATRQPISKLLAER